jgi:translocation and assembly module TamB
VLRRVGSRRYSGGLACSEARLGRLKWQLPPILLTTRIDFSQDDLELSGIEWRLAQETRSHSGVSGHGSIIVRRLPAFDAEASMRAKGDLKVLARLLRAGGLAGGDFNFTGNASYRHGRFQSRGHVQAGEVRVEAPPFRPEHMALSSDYLADLHRIEFPNLRASLLGGEAQGHAEVSFGRSPIPRFALRTEIRGISLSDVLQTLPAGGTLENDVRMAAGINGRAEATWNGRLENFQSQFELSLTPPQPGASAGLRPVTGSVRGSAILSGGLSLAVENAEFHLPHSSLTAQGTLSERESHVALRAQSSDFDEVRRLVQELTYPPTEIPLTLKSTATLVGSVSGPWSDPMVRGRLKLGGFVFRGWTWDGFEGTVSVSSNLARVSSGKLFGDGSTLRFEVSGGLENWKLTNNSSVHISAGTQAASAEGLQRILNLDYRLNGRLTGQVDLTATRTSVAGTGNLRVESGTFHDEPFDWLTAQVRVTNGSWNGESIELAKGKGRATGQVSVEPAKRAFSAQLHGGGFNLADFRLLAPHPYRTSGFALAQPLEGGVSFEAHGQGTLDNPQVQCTADFLGIAVGDVAVGNYRTQLEWRGKRMQVHGESLPAQPPVTSPPGGVLPGGGGTLRFSAKGKTEGDWPFQLDLHYANFRLDPWIDLFRSRALNATVTATGFLNAGGPLKDPGRLEARGQTTDLAVGFQDFQLKGDRPVEISYSKRVLTASRFRLRGPATDLEVEASVNLVPSATLAFKAQGHGDATALAIFDPGIEAAGSFDLNLHGGGTLAQPSLNGTLNVNNLGVAYGGLPFRIAGLNGEIKLQGDRATISSLHGSGGPTAITLSGFATFSGAPAYDLQADLEHARIGFPADFTSVLTGSMHLVGGSGGGRLTGELGVTQMFVSEDFNLLAWMEELSAQLARQSPGVSTPIASKIRLDVQVNSQPQVRVESRNLEVVADIDVNLRGTMASPVPFGNIHIESGSAVIRGDRYRLTRGDISMTNPFRSQISVDMEAQTRIQNYDLTLDVTGPAERTRISYRSDPPLPAEDILSLLALGYTHEAQGLASTSNRPFGSVGASALLSQALSSQTSGRLQRLFGVSRIKIDPNLSGPLASGGPRVTVEEQVARDFRITYSQNTSGTQQRVIQINWDLSDRVSLIGDRDQNGVFGAELRFRRRFK